jgi:hypothetical protein
MLKKSPITTIITLATINLLVNSLVLAQDSQNITIYCDKASVNAKNMIAKKYTITDNLQQANLLWLRKGYSKFYHKLPKNQLLNHIPNEDVMTSKGRILEILSSYDNSKHNNYKFKSNRFIKESYRLYDPQDKQRFIQRYKKNLDDNIWVLKPTSLSRGRGIKFIANQQDFENFILQKSIIDEQKYIAQKHISNVLLLNARKSEIRVYWLIASLDPLMVFFYPEGSVRLCTNPYKLTDFADISVHLTNFFQQKQHALPNTVLKWRFAELNNYLASEKKLPDNYLYNTILENIKQNLQYVIDAAAKDLLQHPKFGLFFGFYGTDIIIDDEFNPWLTDLQLGPGLSTIDPVKRSYFPELFVEAIDIVLEIQDKKSHQLELNEILAQNKFLRLK